MVRLTARATFLAACLTLIPLLSHASEPLVTAAGMGANYLNYVNTQKSTSQGLNQEVRYQFASAGMFVFVDLIKYFTLYAGYRVPVGPVQATVIGPSDQVTITFDYGIGLFDIGAEAKYPFRLNSWFTAAPKLGLEGVYYMTGTLGGRDPGTDGKTIFSPILLSLGADLDFDVAPQVFVRIPIDLGIGLNSRLKESNYEGETNVSTSIVSGKIGCVVGYLY